MLGRDLSSYLWLSFVWAMNGLVVLVWNAGDVNAAIANMLIATYGMRTARSWALIQIQTEWALI